MNSTLALIITFVLMAVYHELGHILAMWYFKVKDIRIETPFRISYNGEVSKHKKKCILFAGILLGLVPMVFFNFNGWGLLILVSAYSCFIMGDIKRLKELGVKFRLKNVNP